MISAMSILKKCYNISLSLLFLFIAYIVHLVAISTIIAVPILTYVLSNAMLGIDYKPLTLGFSLTSLFLMCIVITYNNIYMRLFDRWLELLDRITDRQ